MFLCIKTNPGFTALGYKLCTTPAWPWIKCYCWWCFTLAVSFLPVPFISSWYFWLIMSTVYQRFGESNDERILDCASKSEVLWWLAYACSSGWLPSQTLNLGKSFLKILPHRNLNQQLLMWMCYFVVFFHSIILVFDLFKNILEADSAPPLKVDQILLNCICFGWSG